MSNKKPCNICMSPFRMSIERVARMRIPQWLIAQFFNQYFRCNENTLRVKINKHMNYHLNDFKGCVLMQVVI